MADIWRDALASPPLNALCITGKVSKRGILWALGADVKRVFVNFLLIFSQIGSVAAFLIIAFGGNYWLIPPAVLPLGILVFMAMTERVNCIHCSTPLWDSRTMGTWGPVSPNVVDKCGNCGRGLFE